MILYDMPINGKLRTGCKCTDRERRLNGVSRDADLDYMIRSHVPGVKLSFADAAAISAVFSPTLEEGDGWDYSPSCLPHRVRRSANW